VGLQFFHLGQRQAIDIHQLRGRFHAHLHEIDQVCAPAEKFRARFGDQRAHGL
jgi:hypothetical protein